jgi:hypothetical protein
MRALSFPAAGARMRLLIFGGRGLDRVLVEFADCEARGLVNERPPRSCASG